MKIKPHILLVVMVLAFIMGMGSPQVFAKFFYGSAYANINVNVKDLIKQGKILFDNLTTPSPDGKKIAFVTAKDYAMKGTTIWVADANGQNLHAVANSYTQYGWISNPTWTSDSQSIVYTEANPTKLWIVDVDGSDDRLLSDNVALEYIPYTYGGQTNLKIDGNLLSFENDNTLPAKKYVLNLNTRAVAEVPNSAPLVLSATTTDGIIMPHFHQNDPAWNYKQLGDCPTQTIYTAGCTITAMSMVFKYYGVQEINPDELNQMLSANNYQGYANGCDVRWDVATNYAKGVEFVGAWSYDKIDMNRLDKELTLGHPVIVGIDSKAHWVVITKKDGDDYDIEDPRYPAGVDRKLSDYGGKFDHMVIYYKA